MFRPLRFIPKDNYAQERVRSHQVTSQRSTPQTSALRWGTNTARELTEMSKGMKARLCFASAYAIGLSKVIRTETRIERGRFTSEGGKWIFSLHLHRQSSSSPLEACQL
jgi:hypothetical protein